MCTSTIVWVTEPLLSVQAQDSNFQYKYGKTWSNVYISDFQNIISVQIQQVVYKSTGNYAKILVRVYRLITYKSKSIVAVAVGVAIGVVVVGGVVVV